MAKQVQTKQFQ